MDFGIEDNIFYDEVMNKLRQLEESLYSAKDGTQDKEVINDIFRSIHTVKGVCDLLGFFNIVKLAHKAEDLLDDIRSGKINFTPDIYYVLIELKGFISSLVTDELRGRMMSLEKRAIFDSFLKDIKALCHDHILILKKENKDMELFKELENNSKYETISRDPSNKNILEVLESKNIKLIIWDIDKYEPSTIELLKDLKQNKHYQNIDIILCPANADEQLKNTGIEIKAKAWIKKPFEKKQLDELITKILNS